jgi:hypothetical protein
MLFQILRTVGFLEDRAEKDRKEWRREPESRRTLWRGCIRVVSVSRAEGAVADRSSAAFRRGRDDRIGRPANRSWLEHRSGEIEAHAEVGPGEEKIRTAQAIRSQMT